MRLGDYTTIQTAEQLSLALVQIEAVDLISCDLETTGFDLIKDKIVGIAISVREGQAYYIPIGHAIGDQLDAVVVLAALKPLLEAEDRIIAFHNAKFDTRFFKNAGLHIPNAVNARDLPSTSIADVVALNLVTIDIDPANIRDTMLEVFVAADGHERFGLKYLVHRLYHHTMVEFTELFPRNTKNKNIGDLLIELVAPYACEDADFTRRLDVDHYHRVQTNFIYKLENKLWPIIQRMEDIGFKADLEFLLGTAEYIKAEAEKVRIIILEQVRVAVGHPVDFLITSPKQLREVLFVMMGLPVKIRTEKTKVPATSEEALTLLEKEFPICHNILVYRSMISVSGAMSNTLPSFIREDGRIHTSYNQTGASSGRFSSTDPNMQNIATGKEWMVLKVDGTDYLVTVSQRDAFIAEDDYYLIELDYKQIEFIVMAAEAGEQSILDAYVNGDDVHRQTAALVLRKPIEAVTSAERRSAKTWNYLVIYGGTGYGLSVQTGQSVKDAEADIGAIFRAYPKIASHSLKMKDKARLLHKAVTHFGRWIHIHEFSQKGKRSLSKALRLAINAPIQGCNHADTLIWTGHGLERNESLVGKKFMAWTGQNYVPAEGVLAGLKRQYNVTMSNGHIYRCSPEHWFLTVNSEAEFEWQQASSLVEGTWLISSEVLDNGEPIDEELAELAGRFLGDGDPTARTPYLMFHHTKELVDRDYYEVIAERLGFKTSRYLKKRRADDTVRQDLPTLMFRADYRVWYANLAGNWGRSKSRAIPYKVFGWSLAARRAFLRGLFSADAGWVGRTIVFTTSKEVLGRGTQALLQSVGLASHLGYRRTTHVSMAWRLQVSDTGRYIREIGFRQTYKQEHLHTPGDTSYRLPPVLARAINSALPRPRHGLTQSQKVMLSRGRIGLMQARKVVSSTNLEGFDDRLCYQYLQVKSVEDTGQDVQMYDVVTDSEHQRYVADGVIVHNTAADIQKMGLVRTDKYSQKQWTRDQARNIAQTHDSQTWEIHRSIRPQDILPVLMEAMSPVIPNYPRMQVDAEIGIAWGSMRKYDSDIDYASLFEEWVSDRNQTFADMQKVSESVDVPLDGDESTVADLLPLLIRVQVESIDKSSGEKLKSVLSAYPGDNTVIVSQNGSEHQLDLYKTSLTVDALQAAFDPILPDCKVSVYVQDGPIT